MNKTYIDRSSINLSGESATAVRDQFAENESSVLAEIMVNDRLNRFIAEENAKTGADDSEDPAVPYMGWWWRPVDFFNRGGITVARGNGKVAVCENNKWGYPMRDLTEVEQSEFRTLVWAAWMEARKGGILSEINKKTRVALVRAGDFIRNIGGPFND